MRAHERAWVNYAINLKNLSIPRSPIKPYRFLLLLLYGTSRSRRKFRRKIKEKKRRLTFIGTIGYAIYMCVFEHVYTHANLLIMHAHSDYFLWHTWSLNIRVEWHPRERCHMISHSRVLITVPAGTGWSEALPHACERERERSRDKFEAWGAFVIKIRVVIQRGQGHAS